MKNVIRISLLFPTIISTFINIMVFTMNAMIICIVLSLFKKEPLKHIKINFSYIKKDIVYLLKFLF